jgi:restriction system protein
MMEMDLNLWVIHMADDPNIAERAVREHFICIGWTALGDLNQYKSRESLKEAYRRTWPERSEASVRSSYGQPFRFAHEMQIGDYFVYPVKSGRSIHVGRIKGPYRFAIDDSELMAAKLANVRPVEWLRELPRTAFSSSALHSFGSFSSVSTSNEYFDEVQGLLRGASPLGDANVLTISPDADEVEQQEGAYDLYESAVQETEDFLLKSWIRSKSEFEHVVAAVLEAIGYTAKVTQASGDHGVDVIAHRDPLGLEPPLIKVQVKSGITRIGEPEVSQLLGSLMEGEKGLFISLGGFSPAAQAKARNSSKLQLLDASEFLKTFLDYYHKLAPSWQAKFPLTRVYVPRN